MEEKSKANLEDLKKAREELILLYIGLKLRKENNVIK